MMMMTNDNKDETLIYWTVCDVNIIILKVIFGLGKLASASASALRICPHLTSLLISNDINNLKRLFSIF